MLCLCTLPVLAQNRLELANRVCRALAGKGVPSASFSLPRASLLRLSPPLISRLSRGSFDLMTKASEVSSLSSQENLTRLGVRGPVSSIERFSAVKVTPPLTPLSWGERNYIPRYPLLQASEALGAMENNAIISRAEANEQLRLSLEQQAENISNEIDRSAQLLHRFETDEWIVEQLFNRGASVIGIGQEPHFYSQQGVDLVKSFLDYAHNLMYHRPIVLITPFVRGVNGNVVTQSLQAQGVSPVAAQDVLGKARELQITVVGTAISSHGKTSGLNTISYANPFTRAGSSFEMTALGQSEQQKYLMRVINQYRQENPTALIILWGPSTYVTYNGFNSVTAPLAQQGETVNVLQLSSPQAPSRTESLLPSELQSKLTSSHGFAWPQDSQMPALLGADVFLHVPGNTSVDE